MAYSTSMSRTILFFDDGGVMNDNSRRGPQWSRHAGDFLSARLGGDAARWAEANAVVVPPLWPKYAPIMCGPCDAATDVKAMWNSYQLDWLRSMAAYAGCDLRLSDAECIALAKEASIYITERVIATFPGVIDTLRRLHAEGYVLNTASNQVSHEMAGYLRGMGVRELFPKRVYGQDLLGIAKGNPLFYERLFADTRVDPADAFVFDDSPLALQNAASVGVTTVLVARQRPEGYDGAWIASLADIDQVLPAR